MPSAKNSRALALAGLLVSLGAGAADCGIPDEGNMPLWRAVSLVRRQPETESWQRQRRDAGDLVQYRLLLEEQVQVNGRCYWTVEALAEGRLWRRFYVTPDGKSLLTALPTQ